MYFYFPQPMRLEQIHEKWRLSTEQPAIFEQFICNYMYSECVRLSSLLATARMELTGVQMVGILICQYLSCREVPHYVKLSNFTLVGGKNP